MGRPPDPVVTRSVGDVNVSLERDSLSRRALQVVAAVAGLLVDLTTLNTESRWTMRTNSIGSRSATAPLALRYGLLTDTAEYPVSTLTRCARRLTSSPCRCFYTVGLTEGLDECPSHERCPARSTPGSRSDGSVGQNRCRGGIKRDPAKHIEADIPKQKHASHCSGIWVHCPLGGHRRD